jgi:hypothetical protein
MVNSPPQPELVLFIMIKTPHFVHLYTNFDIFMGFKMVFVYIF